VTSRRSRSDLWKIVYLKNRPRDTNGFVIISYGKKRRIINILLLSSNGGGYCACRAVTRRIFLKKRFFAVISTRYINRDARVLLRNEHDYSATCRDDVSFFSTTNIHDREPSTIRAIIKPATNKYVRNSSFVILQRGYKINVRMGIKVEESELVTCYFIRCIVRGDCVGGYDRRKIICFRKIKSVFFLFVTSENIERTYLYIYIYIYVYIRAYIFIYYRYYIKIGVEMFKHFSKYRNTRVFSRQKDNIK